MRQNRLEKNERYILECIEKKRNHMTSTHPHSIYINITITISISISITVATTYAYPTLLTPFSILLPLLLPSFLINSSSSYLPPFVLLNSLSTTSFYTVLCHSTLFCSVPLCSVLTLQK